MSLGITPGELTIDSPSDVLENDVKVGPAKAAARIPLSPASAMILALAFGLCGGYLDLLIILFRKLFWRDDLTLRVGRDFPWTVPVSHAILLVSIAAPVAIVIWLRPTLISRRALSWLFTTLAIWFALLRLPIYGVCGLLLAAGVGRPLSAAVARALLRTRPRRYILAVPFGSLVVLAALSSGRQWIQERSAVAALPAPNPGARNVLLIVWDTVRAYNLSTYGYGRNTTPTLTELARQGVRYSRAISAAPWTYPSHATFFTGHWPFELNSQWKFNLDTPHPTLAEHLASRGYQTVGLAANTFCVNYETGLARGFAHFDDFPLTPRAVLGRTAPGQWVLMHLLYRGNYHGLKWIGVQSRGALGTNQAFLEWLDQRRTDRPFFAFLNYYDAHDPYIPPPGYEGRFGIRPKGARDYNFLFDYMAMDKDHVQKRDIELARDSYDTCISFLDDSLGRLLAQLKQRGILDNTVVIITSDHGEAFGDHLKYGHMNGLHLDEVGVPLIILSPDAPRGLVVDHPVSLSDLPATVLDQLGLSSGSPFPGQSLASYWHAKPEQTPAPKTTPALSEMATGFAFGLQPTRGAEMNGYELSLVDSGHHYLRDGAGRELLYDLEADPFESVNLVGSFTGEQRLATYRKLLLDVLNTFPGSVEVENAYLKTFRQALAALIPNTPAARTNLLPSPGLDPLQADPVTKLTRPEPH